MKFQTSLLLILLIGFTQLIGCVENEVKDWSKEPLEKVEIAAEQGDAQAQVRLAELYFWGKEVARDVQKSLHWFHQAAKQGHPQAQVELGLIYETGEGVQQDLKQAEYWNKQAFSHWRRKAWLGDAVAQRNLARLYSVGGRVGLPYDSKLALYWYLKAAKQADAEAQYDLGKHYEFFSDVEDKQAKQAEYLFWYRQAAEQGHSRAQYALGRLFDRGGELPMDLEKAAYWYHKAAEQGNDSAMLNLALLYEFGDEKIQDLKKAAYWYHQASSLDNFKAQVNLGVLYYRGKGVQQDFKKAAHYFFQAFPDSYAVRNFRILLQLDEDVLQRTEKPYIWHYKPDEWGNTYRTKRLDDVVENLTPMKRAEVQQITRQYWEENKPK